MPSRVCGAPDLSPFSRQVRVPSSCGPSSRRERTPVLQYSSSPYGSPLLGPTRSRAVSGASPPRSATRGSPARGVVAHPPPPEQRHWGQPPPADSLASSQNGSPYRIRSSLAEGGSPPKSSVHPRGEPSVHPRGCTTQLYASRAHPPTPPPPPHTPHPTRPTACITSHTPAPRYVAAR